MVAVRAISKPLRERFNNIEDNMNQDFRKSRLSNEDLELSDQAYTLLALLCKDEACAHFQCKKETTTFDDKRLENTVTQNCTRNDPQRNETHATTCETVT